MKLPFGSRSSKFEGDLDLDDDVADFGDGFDGPIGVDDFDGLFDDEPDHADPADLGIRSGDDGPVSEGTGEVVPPPEGRRPGRRLRRPGRDDAGPEPVSEPEFESKPEPDHDQSDTEYPNRVPAPAYDDPDLDDPVTADDFSSEMERLRSEASAEQRSAWAYLGVLTALFSFLVLFGYGCSDQGESEVATGEAIEVLETGQASQLVFRIDGDIITLQGTVPTEAARSQLLALAQNAYGAENVIDELTVDPGFSFDAGTIRTIGSSAFEDGRAQELHDAVGSEFGLANRGFEVGFVETVLAPVNAQVDLDDGRATLSGALPDQQSIDDLVALANEVWGPTNVDASLLSIGQTTWTEGRIRLTGRAPSSDQRVQQFTTAVPERLGLLVGVDTAGLAIDDDTAQLSEVEAEVDALLAATPIQFQPLLADIDPASDTVLTQLAELLGRVPTADFEVVGYTDSVGDDQENLLLSQQRAQAIVDRLGELGIAAERMTSRGEGESNPIADNGTDAGRAANRRIEFVFVGADLTEEPTTSTTADPDAESTTTTTEG